MPLSFIDSRVNISTQTQRERAKLKNGIDDFASFSWAGTDMFESFGAFIINEKKGSLKLFNGASFTNNYAKQQFLDGYTNLSGVTFDTQKIGFTIGVYWISIEDYRVLLNLLHPYEVNDLSFSFEPKYCYRCKLASIKESTRHIVGRESTGGQTTIQGYSRLEKSDQSGYRYYTELTLNFDVIGPACAISLQPYIEPVSMLNYKLVFPVIDSDATNGRFVSDLDTPITINIKDICWNLQEQSNTPPIIEAKAVLYDENNQQVSSANLFQLVFKNLPIYASGENSELPFNLTYNSEHGIISIEYGDKTQILTLLTTLTTNSRILKSLIVNQFFIPGRLNFPNIESYSLKVEVTFQENANVNIYGDSVVYARTNVL